MLELATALRPPLLERRGPVLPERGSFLHCQKIRVDGGLPDEHLGGYRALSAGQRRNCAIREEISKNPPYRS
jgi:hypothetical protein